MSLPLSPLAEAALSSPLGTSHRRLYRARERPMPSPLLLVIAAEIPMSLVCFSLCEHGITRNAYSFRVKLATSDLNSFPRLSNTRPFPLPRRVVPPNWRNNPSPGVFIRNWFFSMICRKAKSAPVRVHPRPIPKLSGRQA